MFTVLLVEDSAESKDLVFQSLKNEGLKLAWRSNIAEASALLREQKFDLILLDVELPDGDGFDFYSSLLREEHFEDTAVIFLTVNDEVSRKVLGFTLGAEDFIAKPFHPAEFRIRLLSRLKKLDQRKAGRHELIKGGILLQVPYQRALRLEGASKTDLGLTPLEFKILCHLMSHEEQVMSRDQLIDAAWGEAIHLTDRTIDSHIYTLRKKLGPQSHYVESIYGQGYRFTLQAADKKQAA